MSVCADQLLLELADAEQIIALSRLAKDSDAAYNHRKAAAFKQTKPVAESVLALQPDLVIASSYGQKNTISQLKNLGLRVEKMPIAQTLDEVFNNIVRVGDWLGKSSEVKYLNDQLRARLKKLPPVKTERPLAAIFDANGYTVGKNTLRGEMLELAGFDNLANKIGITHYGKIPLESLLIQAPEALVDSPYAEGTYSRAQELPKHPALRRSKLAPTVIPLAVNSTICAGPWTIDNIETLANRRVEMQNLKP